jgi:hypothetical protein
MRGGWTEHIALFCTPDNYVLLERLIRQKTGQADTVNTK